MSKVQENDRVRITYSGALKCGIVFDSVYEESPYDFTLGVGSALLGLEKQIIGMKEGESKSLFIKPEEGFGEHRRDLVIKVNRSEISFNGDPTLGMTFQVPSTDGAKIWVEIVGLDKKTIEFDANHTLAGRELVYNVTLIKILSKD